MSTKKKENSIKKAKRHYSRYMKAREFEEYLQGFGISKRRRVFELDD
ncbi:MAG: hypothetical protein GF353_26840 [Candidatus Lokiarchaeota archaeon]|nr:hypothetical protein [Candidatus Lokiarchaeota archaeon]